MSRRRSELAGKTFGRLTAIEVSHVTQYAYWKCLCECGNSVVVRGSNLSNGHTKSCGCLVAETAGKLNRRHGRTETREHKAWAGMWNRCTNPSYHLYACYGGRGVSVCEAWKSFDRFYMDMGPKPSARHSLDRIDVNGDYEPGNCRWATAKQQQRNKTNNVVVTVDGIRASVAEHCERTGVSLDTAYYRLRNSIPLALVFKPGNLRELRKELEKA